MNFSHPKQPSSPKQQPLDNALKNKLNNFNLQIPQFLSIPNLFSSQNKTLIDDALNNIQTRFSNIDLRFPNPFSSSSILDNLFFKKNQALSSAEIKKRMAGIPVYTISNHSEDRCIAVSRFGDRDVEFFYLSKSDAENYAEGYMQHYGSRLGDLYTLQVPLTDVVDYEGTEAPIRLVPELSQVENATEERRKDSVASPDDVRFSGVPVFQTEHLSFEYSKKPGKKYRPLFLRKEDLERTLDRFEVPDSSKTDRSDIQVVALEDIIHAMKDCSTSKWNDVVLVAPGLTLSTWSRWDHPLI